MADPLTKPFDQNLTRRIRARAEQMWRDEGSPPGGPSAFLDRARELVALEEDPKAGTAPAHKGYNRPGPWGEPVEQTIPALDNEGEFPTTTDQGEQETPEKLTRRKHQQS